MCTASVFRVPEEEDSEKELPRDKTLSNLKLPIALKSRMFLSIEHRPRDTASASIPTS